MNHPDQNELVTFALGEPTDSKIHGHISGCDDCAEEVSRLQDVVAATTRLEGNHVVLEPPPDHVWSAILAEALEQPPPPHPTDPVAPVPPVVPTSRVAMQHRRRRVLAGAVMGFALGIAATVLITLIVDRDDSAPGPQADPSRTIAEGIVEPIGGARTSGSVTVLQDHEQRTMRITINQAPTSRSDFVQAWLLNPRNNDMIALGVMGDRSETFPLPRGVDLDDYNSVDISLEPFDGDPQHSATSLARGSITPR